MLHRSATRACQKERAQAVFSGPSRSLPYGRELVAGPDLQRGGDPNLHGMQEVGERAGRLQSMMTCGDCGSRLD